jgi:steroid 5-alpha reductase family enzyme
MLSNKKLICLPATWIFVVGLPVYLANATPARLHPRLNAFDFAAIAFASTCFGLEVLADSQKAKWKRDKNAKLHDEKFISSGLWGISRHPK